MDKISKKKCNLLRLHQNWPDLGNSLVVQWLGLHALTAEGPGSIPGQGTKIPQATGCGEKKKKNLKNKQKELARSGSLRFVDFKLRNVRISNILHL